MAFKNSSTEDDKVTNCTGDEVQSAFPEVARLEICNDCCPSFLEGSGSVSESLLRSVMPTLVHSTLTFLKSVAIRKDEEGGYK